MINTEQLIKEIDINILYKLVKEIGEADCHKESCLKCQLHKRIKSFTDSIDSNENKTLILLGTLRISTLFYIGFLTALSYIEVKELESLHKK